jgi:hypothetical protein
MVLIYKYFSFLYNFRSINLAPVMETRKGVTSLETSVTVPSLQPELECVDKLLVTPKYQIS